MEISQYIKEFFKELKFEEEQHKYYVNGKILSKSVSQICSQYVDFDRDAILKRTALSRNVSVESLDKAWKKESDTSIVIGKSLHKFAEDTANGETVLPTTKLDIQFQRFLETMPKHYKIVAVELIMYHKDYLFAGTCDLLVYDEINKGFILIDYKTNKDLHKNFKGKKLLFPFEGIYDTPLNKYMIQLSLYKILLEQVPEVKVLKSLVVWFKEDSFEMYECEDYTKVLNLELYKNFGCNLQEK